MKKENQPRRSLNFDEFIEATRKLNMKVELKLAARLYMVEGKSFSEAAELSGINDRSIQRKVREIWATHQNSDLALPDGWVREDISLPKTEMIKVKALSLELLSKIKGST